MFHAALTLIGTAIVCRFFGLNSEDAFGATLFCFVVLSVIVVVGMVL